MCEVGALISQGKEQFWGHSQPVVKYKEYRACGRHSRSYLVGGSGGAAFAADTAATCYGGCVNTRGQLVLYLTESSLCDLQSVLWFPECLPV